MAKLNKAEKVQQMNAIAQRIGARHGYESVTADFSPFADFKVAWERSYRVASFHVSDYLMGADEKAIECVFDSIFNKILGLEDTGYNESFKAYVNSKTFTKNKAKFIKRHKDIYEGSQSERGEYTIVRTRKLESYISPLFRVIAVCDDDDVDDIFDEKVAEIKMGRAIFE